MRLLNTRVGFALWLAPVAVALVGCSGGEPDPAAQSVLDGEPPSLRSWSGAANCCGEDPHPVHGATLADGSVVMVGKAAASGEQTAGFITHWAAPEGPAYGNFVDDAGGIILHTMTLEPDSSLLQVASAGDLVVAVGFQAASGGETAHGVVLALDAATFDVRAQLRVDAPQVGESTALESVLVTTDGRVVVGGAWGLAREQMEGFKSYGNVVGGQGVVMEFELAAWLSAAEGGAVATPADVSAVSREIPETFSVKSMRRWSDGSVVAVASDLDERSGVLWVDAGLTGHRWMPYAEGIELTDVSVFTGLDQGDAIAVVGHGGSNTIDGHAALMDTQGAVMWTATFGNPGLDASEVPDGGLAPDKLIFDECWGVAQRGASLVVACGTGIEGCGAVEATASEQQACEGDPRRSWRSYLVAVDGAGEVLWSRADSFVESTGEASESAAEFVVVDAAGDIYAIIDQVFGVGLARFGS